MGVVVKLYSYVVEHDNGQAPNPYFDFCTLCLCKFRKSAAGRKNIVELAEVGDWVIGTGGANRRKSAGHGKLVYAMRVDEKPSRWKYFRDSRFARKKPKAGTYKQSRGDNIQPSDDFEKHKQFALVSHSQHFYYFGKEAKNIRKFDLEKKGPGFRCHFEQAKINQFIEWLRKTHPPGKHGEPCQTVVNGPKGSNKCKSSC